MLDFDATVTDVSKERQLVWDVLAQIWVDTTYDAEQLDQFANRLVNCGFGLRDLDQIANREVCGAFATFTLAVIFTAGMVLPDWYFPEDVARRRITSWLSRPRFRSLLNPFWIVGYFASRWFLNQTWPELRGRVARRLGEAQAIDGRKAKDIQDRRDESDST